MINRYARAYKTRLINFKQKSKKGKIMTKMKSKKMTKSTFAVIIMAIVMVALLAFGGTYAYFTANATGESVGNIKTAKLQLLNKGSRLTYTATDEIVPGKYIYGTGDLSGTNVTDYQVIDLDLGDTNAAVYAFVRVTTMAYTGAYNPETSTPITINGTGTDTSAAATSDDEPVLKLLPKLATGKWTKLESESGKSTYVYYFEVADTAEARTAFNDENFNFALQFDWRVQADRKQDGNAQTSTETNNTIEFATIQQLGWDELANKEGETKSKYELAFAVAFDYVNADKVDRDENQPLA